MGTRRRDKIEPLSSLGRAVRTRREALGLSQEELGSLADLHRTYVGSVERGERNITTLCLIRLAKALNMLPSELLERSGL